MKNIILIVSSAIIANTSIAQNAGIGTSTPAAKLDIRHTSSISDPTLLLYDNSPSNYARLQLQNASGNKFWHVAGYIDDVTNANSRLNFFHSVTGDVMSLTGDGKVGIGTINPSSKLHIKGGAAEKIKLEGNGNSIGFYNIFDGSQLGLLGLSGFGIQLATLPSTNYPIRFYTNGNEVMTLSENGNIGINNFNPAYKLDINGSINITNSFTVSGQPGTSGQVLTSAGGGSAPIWASLPQAPQVSFFGYLINNTSISSYTPTTVTGYGELHDDGNNFNIASGVFLAPSNGVYHFDAKMSFSSQASGNTPITVRIKKNGFFFEGCQSEIILQAVTGYTLSISHAVTISLIAGDAITIEVIQSSAGSLSLLGGSSAASCFSGYRVY